MTATRRILGLCLTLCVLGATSAQAQQKPTLPVPSQQITPAPIDPKVLDQQIALPPGNPAGDLQKLTAVQRKALLAKWLAALPLDERGRARAATGRMQRYQVYLAGTRRTGTWGGLLMLADWRRDKAVDLGGRADGKPNWWRYNADAGTFYKWLRGADGRQKGVLVVRPGDGFAMGLDLDGDRTIDLMGTMDGRYNTDWLVGVNVSDLLDAWGGLGLDGLCLPLAEGAEENAPAAGGSSSQDQDVLGALDICGNDNDAGGGGGGGAASGSGTAGNGFSGPNDDIGDMCERVLAAGRPGGGGVPGSVRGDGPYDFDWGKAWEAFKNGGIAPGTGIIDRALGLGGLLSAADLAKRIGDALNAGAPQFVNDADEALWRVDRMNEECDCDRYHVTPQTLQAACSAGSQNSICAEWRRANEEAQRDAEEAGQGSGGTSSGGGSTQPAVGEETGGSWDEAMYDRCLARARTQDAWGTSENNAAPDNDCLDPAVNPGGAAASAGGEDIRCPGDGSDESEQPNITDVMASIAAAAGRCRDDGLGGTRCEPSMGPQIGGRRGSSGIALGAILGMDCAANPACDPSSAF